MPDSDEACAYCGLTYESMRTGLSYSEVYMMLWSFDEDSSTWRYKRRHTVLGLWRSVKIDLWHHHLKSCTYEYEQAQEVAQLEAETAIDHIPW